MDISRELATHNKKVFENSLTVCVLNSINVYKYINNLNRFIEILQIKFLMKDNRKRHVTKRHVTKYGSKMLLGNPDDNNSRK